MIRKTPCCLVPYVGEWRGLKLYAVCKVCRKRYEELGFLIIYDEGIVCE